MSANSKDEETQQQIRQYKKKESLKEALFVGPVLFLVILGMIFPKMVFALMIIGIVYIVLLLIKTDKEPVPDWKMNEMWQSLMTDHLSSLNVDVESMNPRINTFITPTGEYKRFDTSTGREALIFFMKVKQKLMVTYLNCWLNRLMMACLSLLTEKNLGKVDPLILLLFYDMIKGHRLNIKEA